jgi:prepilin-type N-terminal cleavage/methylation domain-containing protein
MNKSTKKQLAFTLIELLVVIAIIGILSALIVVGMSSTTQKASIAKSQVFANSLRNSLMGNLVSEWRLDGNASDSWSGGNNGNWYGAGGGTNLVANYRPVAECISGQCLNFDGTDDYVNCGHGTSLSFVNGIFTIEGWIKPTGWAGAQGIIMERENYLVSGFRLSGNMSGENKLLFRTSQSGGTISIISDVFLNLNTYYHFAITRDGTTSKLYLNSLQNSISSTGTYINNAADDIYIGSYQGIPNYDFAGLIDDIRIYNIAIPTSQIQQDYFVGLNKLLAKNQINGDEYQQRLAELSNNYAEN